nr:hypothetical protein [Comamonas jiangduensis]
MSYETLDTQHRLGHRLVRRCLDRQAANWGDTLRQQATQLGGSGTAESSGSTSALGGLLGSGSGAAAGGLLSSLGVPASGSVGNAAV